MNDSESPISRRRRPALWRGAAVALAAIVAGPAIVIGPAVQPAEAAVTPLASTFTVAQSRRLLGTDGRFTILLLGGDARGPRAVGGRTDAILVASVNPATGKAAILSIPRDTVNFPLSATRRYPGKINALYPYLARIEAAKPVRLRRNPGTVLRKIVGSALRIEIDAFALVGFTGFRTLVNEVEGVSVYVARTITDPKYTIIRDGRRVRVTFRQGWNNLTDLRALAYARIRYLDSDYARARRQQQLIAAAVGKVTSRGVGALADLLAAGRGLFRSDLPLADAALIYAMVSQANLAGAKRVVFGPRTYALGAGPGMIVLRLAVCRTWIRRNFPAATPGGAWLPPAPVG